MQTEVLQVDASSRAEIARAAGLLRGGEVVAFPTETVYGLGADARIEGAVQKIFAAKGRPSTRPLILHVDGAATAAGLVEGWDARAALLAARYWPGPLTLVMPKAREILDVVTAAGPTVAVRAPRHPVARALIDALGAPIAAPSANRSDRLSPTLAEHVLADLGGLIPLILDGGPTEVGLESTIVDLSSAHPRVLREGAIPAAEIGRALEVELEAVAPARPLATGVPTRLFAGTPPAEVEVGRTLVLLRSDSAWRPAQTAIDPESRGIRLHLEILPADPDGYAQKLYEALRRAEALGVDTVWVEAPPNDDAWSAIRVRLRSVARS